MQSSDPNAPRDNEDGAASDDTPHAQPPVPKTTTEIFEEIVAQLSDLSTNVADDKTTPPPQDEFGPQELSFPTAIWVTGPRIEPAQHEAPSGPRDWEDDMDALSELDRFVEPNPRLEFSADPVRNVGLFLTTLGGLAMLIYGIFMRPVHGPSMLVLLALFLIGISLLIWRLPTNPPGSSGDSGAVV